MARDGTIKTLKARFAFIEPRDGSSKDVYAPYESWSHLASEKGFQRSARVSFESRANEKGEQVAIRVSLVIDQRIPKKINSAMKRRSVAGNSGEGRDFENDYVSKGELKRTMQSQKFPVGLARALGSSAKLRYRRPHNLYVEGSPENASRVSEILSKQKYPGFYEWLVGACGWRIQCSKVTQNRVVALLERIQKCYKKHMKAMKSEHARELFYQHGHEGASAKRTEVWTLGTKDNLKSYVERTRSFFEVILFYKMDRNWTKTDWLDEKSWSAVCQQASRLMRGSDHGPDVPVQWASHQPRNHYPLSVVTESSLQDLVVGLATILFHMFKLDDKSKAPVGHSLASVQNFLDSLEEEEEDDDLEVDFDLTDLRIS